MSQFEDLKQICYFCNSLETKYCEACGNWFCDKCRVERSNEVLDMILEKLKND